MRLPSRVQGFAATSIGTARSSTEMHKFGWRPLAVRPMVTGHRVIGRPGIRGVMEHTQAMDAITAAGWADELSALLILLGAEPDLVPVVLEATRELIADGAAEGPPPPPGTGLRRSRGATASSAAVALLPGGRSGPG